MIFQQTNFRPITLWFKVEFYNYFTGMITILRQYVTCNIWVATFKAKITAGPCSKIVSGPTLCYLKSDFTTTFDKQLPCVQYLFREHYLVPTGSCIWLAVVADVNINWFARPSLYWTVGNCLDNRYSLYSLISWDGLSFVDLSWFPIKTMTCVGMLYYQHVYFNWCHRYFWLLLLP